MQDVLKRLASLLDMSGFGEIDTSRATARVPIIMFVDTGVTGIHCDVCINNELALRNTQLLKAYSQIDERVRLIAYVVKTWSKRRRINEPSDGTLSSYAYLLLLLSRLQSVGMLPYLQSLPEDWSGQEGFGEHSGKGSRVKSPNGQEWDTYFYDPSANGLARALAKGCKISIGQILVEFFWHYAFERSFRREVVSVRIKGGSISKDAKVDEYGWKRNARLSIEDPFEHAYDVAHVIRDDTLKRIKGEFARAWWILATGGGLQSLLEEVEASDDEDDAIVRRRPHTETD